MKIKKVIFAFFSLRIKIFKEIENENSIFLCTEFYPGGDLSSLISKRVKQKNPLSIWEVKVLMRAIMSALVSMHS